MTGAAAFAEQNVRGGIRRRNNNEGDDDEHPTASIAAPCSVRFDVQDKGQDTNLEDDELWTENDEVAYTLLKNRLRNAHKFQVPWYSPDPMMLLALPPKVARARLYEFAAALNLVYGLIGATIGQMALDPLDLSELPSDEYFFVASYRSLGLAYNVVMTLCFVMCMCGILFTVYFLLVINCEYERSVRRIIVHLGAPFAFWQWMTWFTCILPLLGMFFLLMIRMSEVEALCLVLAGVVVYCIYHIHWFCMALKMAPNSGVGWGNVMCPVLVSREDRDNAQKIVEARFPNLDKKENPRRPTLKHYQTPKADSGASGVDEDQFENAE